MEMGGGLNDLSLLAIGRERILSFVAQCWFSATDRDVENEPRFMECSAHISRLATNSTQTVARRVTLRRATTLHRRPSPLPTTRQCDEQPGFGPRKRFHFLIPRFDASSLAELENTKLMHLSSAAAAIFAIRFSMISFVDGISTSGPAIDA